MKFFSRKVIECKKADIHLHYANNKGRGGDNVTVTIVEPGTERLSRSGNYKNYIRQYRTSGWKGIVNIDVEEFGGEE